MFLVTSMLFLSLTTCSLSISWPRKVSQGMLNPKTAVTSTATFATLDSITEAEINSVIFNQDSLENYSRRPDCFREAASVIRTQCGQLDMGEGERVNAAISMTLCEIATATHHSIPFECAPFSLDSVLYEQPPNLQLQGACVDAFSRSAQFWSSYSGYLRETPQLCFAFRRWNDIDTARDIYKNATLEKAALLRVITAREKVTETILQSWDSQLMKFQEAISQLQSASVGISTISTQTHVRLKTDMADSLMSFRDVHRREIEQVSQLLSQALERVLQDHARELSAHMASLVTSQVDSAVAHSLADKQVLLSLTNQIQERMVGFGAEINDLSQAIFLLFSASSEAARTFNDSFREARFLRDVQKEASLSTVQLVDAISQLTRTTHAELEKINSTTVSIRRTLLLQDNGPIQWLCTASMNALRSILQLKPESLAFMNDLPIYRITFAALGLFGCLLRVALSGIMTMVVATFSVRRYLLKYAKSSYVSSAFSFSKEPPVSQAVSPSLPLSNSLKDRLQSSSPYIHHGHYLYRQPYSPRVSRIPDRLYRLESSC